MTNITGKVLEGETGRGLPGVAVSDGVSVVKTDEHGAFTLTRHARTRFVFVSTPGQYVAEGPFYRDECDPNDGKALEFRMKSSPVGDDFYFGEIADPTLSAYPDFKNAPRRLQPDEQCAVLSGAAREIAAMDPRPQFLVMTGDLTCGMHALSLEKARRQMALYVTIRRNFELPAYDVIGNHDHALIAGEDAGADVPEFGPGLFEELLGPTWYSFNRGRWHFAVLNAYTTDDGTMRIRLGEAQLNWLARDLAVAGPSTPCVLFMHEELCDLADRTELLAILHAHNVKAFVSGHFHSNMHFDYEGIRCIVTGALCAGWWWRDQWATGRGYGLFHLHGDDLDFFYARCGDPNAVQILEPRSWSVIGGKVELACAVLAMGDPPATVTCQVGETDFVPMRKTGNGPWPVWTHTVNTADYPDGSLRLQVRTVNQHGRTETCHRYVVIKNCPEPIGVHDAELRFTVQGASGPSEVHLNGQAIGTVPFPTPEPVDALFPVPAALVHRTNRITFIPARLGQGEAAHDRFAFKDLRIHWQGRDYFRAGFRPHLFSPVRADRDDPRADRTDIPCVIPPAGQVDSMVLNEH